LSVISVLAIIVIALSFLYWKISSGPVELAFLNARIESAINAQLVGTSTKIGRTILEMDRETGVPTVRFVNISLMDDKGTVIARAPKAGLELDLSDWISGNIKPRSFDLYGAKINAIRTFDGSFELGIAEAPPEDGQIDINFNDAEPQSADKGDLTGEPQKPEFNLGKSLMAILNASNSDSPISALSQIRVRRAQFNFEDELNDARWYLPETEIVIDRTAEGLALHAAGSVASSGAPWGVKLDATYSRETRKADVKAQVDNVVPVDVANKIYALSQFARFKSPLSGTVNFIVGSEGAIEHAEGQLVPGKGAIDLPNYFARQLVIDGGELKFGYDISNPVLVLKDSFIIVNGAHAALTGSFTPLRGPEGKLKAVKISLDSRNAAEPADPAKKKLLERITFEGRTSIDEPRLDIDDLVAMNGQTGVRLRGIISGGEQSNGLQLAGRMRDIDDEFLKALWPPIVTPNTRAWVQQNIIDGRISEGTFQVNLPPDALARALKDEKFAPGSISMNIKLTDVISRYFKGLSPIREASGTGILNDDNFDLTLDQGKVELDGETITIDRGEFHALNLLLAEPPGTFQFDVSGTAKGLKTFLGQSDVKNLNVNPSAFPNISGKIAAHITMALPLIKAVPKERVDFTAALKLTEGTIAEVAPGIDLTGANLDIAFNEESMSAKGPARLNGVSSEIDWQKSRKTGDVKTTVQTTLDVSTQKKLGITLAPYAKGDIPLKMTATGKLGDNAQIEADLSGIAMSIEALNWQRKPTRGTKLSMSLKTTPAGRVLDDINIAGSGVAIKGTVTLGKANTFKQANLTDIRLGDDYVFAARIEPADGATRITVKGNTFDARPYIKAIISPKRDGDSKSALPGQTYIIDANFDRVYANRGEIVENVSAQMTTARSTVQRADITGRFLSGLPISVKLTPTDAGRELRVNSTDGGATLRAADFYGKVAGGTLEFAANVANEPGSPIRNGQLRVRNFQVRNEAALAELDRRGKPRKSGPRRDGLSFKRFRLDFNSDSRVVELKDIELKGNELGAVARGRVYKGNGALVIGGTVIPAQGINGALDDLPILGTLLSGGNNEGVIGITFCLGGTIQKPKWQMNPLSVILPGILRKITECQLPKADRNQQDIGSSEVTGSAPSPY
jgi:hypothetical protein